MCKEIQQEEHLIILLRCHMHIYTTLGNNICNIN